MIEIQFPTELSRGALGGDAFDTQVAPLPNANEKRNARRSVAMGQWSIAFNNRDKTKFQALRNFFLAVKGQHESFRFQDRQDYESDTQQDCSPATGNGSNTVFQLQKSYTIASPATAYVRTVTKPVAGTVRMYVNGVEVLSPGNWSVDTATGIVTFVVAPTSTHTVKATYEFDKVVRFGSDVRESSIEAFGIYTWSDIQLVEVPE